ncbi:MAG: DUF5018 domain-containing protein [Methanolinea sp.]|nr:DUF5018 domain-containing protein [Methanolinea sp.]
MRRTNTWSALASISIMGIVILASGCLSPEVLLPDQGHGGETSPTALPTEGPYPAVTREEPVPGVVQVAADAGGPAHYVATPYGYVLARPQKGLRLVVMDIREETDASGQKFLSGRIKNEEQARISHVTLQFNLYNANGNLLGNTYASVNSLPPGKIWRFSTDPIPYRDYQYYELAEIFAA